MAHPRKKLRALIDLATNEKTPEEEARTAAMLACKLIKEHGLLGASAQEPVHVTSAMDDIFSAFNVHMYTPRSEAPAPPPPQPRVVGDDRPRHPPDPDARFVPVTSAERCAGCGQRIPYGSFAMWSHTDLWHRVCWDETETHDT